MKKIQFLAIAATVAVVILGSAFTKTTSSTWYLYDKQANGSNFDLYLVDPSAVGEGEIIDCSAPGTNCQVSYSGTQSPTDQGDVLKLTNVPTSDFSEIGTPDKFARIVQE